MVYERIKRTSEINDWIRKRYRERRATKRHARLPKCLETRLRPERRAVRAQEYLGRQPIQLLEASILKRGGYEAGIEESEDNRDPRALNTADIRKNGTRARSGMQSRNDCVRRCNRLTADHLRRQSSDPRPALSAVRQTLSEHAWNETPLQKPDHHLYSIDVFPPSGILSWLCNGS